MASHNNPQYARENSGPKKLNQGPQIPKHLRTPSYERLPDLVFPSSIGVLHYGAIHAIRKFAVEEGFGVIFGGDHPYEPYAELADCCRSAMAASIKRDPEVLHCTIRYCSAKKGELTHEWKVWTFAQSTVQSTRPVHLGPDYACKVGENSGFAAILGCNDTEDNNWGYKQRVFACGNLSDEAYACSCKDWSTWYNSLIVFPLRYPKWNKKEKKIYDHVMGFFTVDSLKPNIFGAIPSIFDYKDEPAEYLIELAKHDIYHTGGIIADHIATAMMLERKLRKSRKKEIKETGNENIEQK